ncbi:MAG: hypothetical protein II415_07275 [Bacteroidaceae bacterium]|jgi:hypothetical protein|nr:hypothetical protein [Bacteroidaceae bacterium]
MKKLLILSVLSLAFVACGGIYKETYREAYDYSSGGYYYNRPDGGYNVLFRKGSRNGGYYNRRDRDYYGYYLNENNRRVDFGKNPGNGYRDPAGAYRNGFPGNTKTNPDVIQPKQNNTQQDARGQNRGTQVGKNEVSRTSANPDNNTNSRSRRTTTRDKVDESIKEMTK